MQNEDFNVRQKLNARFKKLGCRLNEFNGYQIHLPDDSIVLILSLDQAEAEILKMEAHFKEVYKNDPR